MHIDARELEYQELVLKVREMLTSKHGNDVNVEILISSIDDAKKVKAFVSMSGCKSEIDKKNSYYIMRIKGTPCCT